MKLLTFAITIATLHELLKNFMISLYFTPDLDTQFDIYWDVWFKCMKFSKIRTYVF